MLRTHQSASAAQAKRYFVESLDRGDYYTKDAEAPGLWFGKGAERLGLAGTVGRDDFFALLENRKPGTGERLTVRDKGNRRPGWDLVFSPPKSVSAVRALTGDERIAGAMMESVAETLAELEADGIATRDRRGGRDGTVPTGNLIASLFWHDTTRALGDGKADPHDHVHAFIHNGTWAAHESRWQAVEMSAAHYDRPYYEAAFEARLAGKLVALGYGVERHAGGWEIARVTQTAIDKLSRRTAEIEAEARRKGVTDAREKAGLGAKTRRKKDTPVPREDLVRYWRAKLTDDEWRQVSSAWDRAAAGPAPATKPELAVRHAADHHFERDSTVPVKTLLATALKFGAGSVTPEQVKAEAGRQKLLTAVFEGRLRATSAGVLGEEQSMLHFARDGRGACDPLGGYRRHKFVNTELNAGQRRAVTALLESFDRVQVLRGLAGVGKSTALGELRLAVEAAGGHVLATAPTTPATDVLVKDGFEAVTVAMLLKNERLHDKLRGATLLIDEGGLVGSRDMARLFALAERYGSRVIVSGDTGQHRSPARGAAMRLLEDRAGLKPVGLTEIVRQWGRLKEAVAALAGGDAGAGFERLDVLGVFREIADAGDRYRQLAAGYADTLETNLDALCIAPTHAEGAKAAAAIRAELKTRGLLGADDKAFTWLESRHLSEPQRKDAVSYVAGDVVQFTQNVKGGWKRSERATVVGRTGDAVTVRNAAGVEKPLPLAAAEHFEVYRPRDVPLAVGERVRFTLNATLPDGKPVKNGSEATVTAFTAKGLKLSNGRVVPWGHGHLAGGWTVTSVAAQGRTVAGNVFVAQAAESRPASSKEQFYVSLSRIKGCKGVSVFTDDKAALRAAVSRTDRPLSATELLDPRPAPAPSWAEAAAEKIRRLKYHAKLYARLGVEHVRGRIVAAAEHLSPREMIHER